MFHYPRLPSGILEQRKKYHTCPPTNSSIDLKIPNNYIELNKKQLEPCKDIKDNTGTPQACGIDIFGLFWIAQRAK